MRRVVARAVLLLAIVSTIAIAAALSTKSPTECDGDRVCRPHENSPVPRSETPGSITGSGSVSASSSQVRDSPFLASEENDPLAMLSSLGRRYGVTIVTGGAVPGGTDSRDHRWERSR